MNEEKKLHFPATEVLKTVQEAIMRAQRQSLIGLGASTGDPEKALQCMGAGVTKKS